MLWKSEVFLILPSVCFYKQFCLKWDKFSSLLSPNRAISLSMFDFSLFASAQYCHKRKTLRAIQLHGKKGSGSIIVYNVVIGCLKQESLCSTKSGVTWKLKLLGSSLCNCGASKSFCAGLQCSLQNYWDTLIYAACLSGKSTPTISSW